MNNTFDGSVYYQVSSREVQLIQGASWLIKFGVVNARALIATRRALKIVTEL